MTFDIFHNYFPSLPLLLLFVHGGKQGKKFRFFNFMIAHSLATPHSKFLWKYSSKNTLFRGWSCGSSPTAWDAKTQPFWPFWIKLWHDVARGLKLLIPFMKRISLGILWEAKIRIMHTELWALFIQVFCFSILFLLKYNWYTILYNLQVYNIVMHNFKLLYFIHNYYKILAIFPEYFAQIIFKTWLCCTMDSALDF